MAYIDKEYKRLIRIEGIPGIPGIPIARGSINITDAETGELVNNVIGMVIRLEVGHVNECEITYAEMSEHGYIQTDEHNQLIKNTVNMPDVTIVGITAYEVDNWEEQFDGTFCLYEMTEDGFENVEDKVKSFIRGLLSRR